ncbi:MAG: hypothetical protein AUJ51_11075 [Elusimicrobia bacterium CG1_02_56_21]|nr:MAG: hypothetical protein AUJ51_11075 [Elusimicrobia bacterium CG1_02_56_21]
MDMRGTKSTILYLTGLAACLAAAILIGSEWEKKLQIFPVGADLQRAQAAYGEEYTSREKRTETGTSQKIYREGASLKAQYRFINFNKDRVSVNFAMPGKSYSNYLSGYGYTDAEMSRLKAWRETTRQAVWKQAYARSGKAAAEKAIANVETDYDTRLRALLRARGLALRAGNIVECDMPVIVKRNISLLKPMAMAFQKIASGRKYAEEDLIGAVLSMVQTAIRYKIPPSKENGLHTCGLLPPARALLSGWGDCDTKTGLLAAILGNWSGMRIVGVAVPGHYLMAIRRLPGKGDMFVRYKGLEYVLVEPAGPAWLEPGTVGSATTALLSGREGYKIEPFF